MTEKQSVAIKQIEEHYGKDHVVSYFRKFFPEADYEQKTKEQAQKIITGLRYGVVGGKPIRGVFGRDFCPRKYL